MTLTELKYIVAVARERHFGRAAEACFVSQPTLSVAVKKLEDELGISIFERGNNEITLTEIGEQIVSQAQRVLEETHSIKELARHGKNPLAGPLRLGVIYTIGPYLLPALVKQMIQSHPDMPLLLQENYTHKLLELLRQGQLDAAIMALPLPDTALHIQPLYDEPFVVAMSRTHAQEPGWQQGNVVSADELKSETMLLLGAGHCFRDNVLEVCPEFSRYSQTADGIQKTVEGSSLETIRYMVAAGIGITVLPQLAVPNPVPPDSLLKYLPFVDPVPTRRVVLVWRRSFTRRAAIQSLREAVYACQLAGVQWLHDAPVQTGG